tara:strand:- start:8898 stop:10718 length:1821 start_codon:yes stop_codon:yes gene_type:complete
MLPKLNLYPKLCTLLKLGPLSLIKLFKYKIKIAYGINPVTNKSIKIKLGNFFNDNSNLKFDMSVSNLWEEHISMYGYNINDTNTKKYPIWNNDYILDKKYENKDTYWNKINIQDIIDIKNIWELSRFDWAIYFAQRVSKGEKKYLKKLNSWIQNWFELNQPYRGMNWICAQETSIRLLNLICVSIILNNQKNINNDFKKLIKIHLEKIFNTIDYGVAQDNNHGLIEAAGLICGGIILKNNGINNSKYINKGKSILEDRMQKLIFNDGGFSQYSMNYHRVMLDGISMTKVVSKMFNENIFNEEMDKKARKGIKFLYNFTNKENGFCPNIGNNDGAKLIPLDSSDYRDFRPSIQFASHLFMNESLYKNNQYNDAKSLWMDVQIAPKKNRRTKSKIYKNSGIAILRNKDYSLYFKFPSFKYRPSQADSLHFDLNIKGKNIMCDAGTFSYNEKIEKNNFRGSSGHNLAEFDGKDHMRKFSNFLYMDWLKANDLTYQFSSKNNLISCYVIDYRKIKHSRKIETFNNEIIIVDKFNNNFNNGFLRFRLNNINNSDWTFKSKEVINNDISIKFSKEIKIKEGWKSEYYMRKEKINIAEIKLNASDQILTKINF